MKGVHPQNRIQIITVKALFQTFPTLFFFFNEGNFMLGNRISTDWRHAAFLKSLTVLSLSESLWGECGKKVGGDSE